MLIKIPKDQLLTYGNKVKLELCSRQSLSSRTIKVDETLGSNPYCGWPPLLFSVNIKFSTCDEIIFRKYPICLGLILY